MSDTAAPSVPPEDAAFDQALVEVAFRQAALVGWHNVQIAQAARQAGLSMARARHRFPSRAALLVRFGRMADAAALAEPAQGASVRDRLFGMLMRRFDVLEGNRAGVLALLSSLPCRPHTALFLALLNEASMRWMLDAAGASTAGLAGRLRIRGLLAVWLWALRAWARDETPDLAPTMAALDTALARAERAAGWLDALPGPGAAGATGAASEASGAEKAAPDGPAADEPFRAEGEPPEEKPEG